MTVANQYINACVYGIPPDLLEELRPHLETVISYPDLHALFANIDPHSASIYLDGFPANCSGFINYVKQYRINNESGIGYTNNGDYIIINLVSGELYVLDHVDTSYRQYLNKSVFIFLNMCLLRVEGKSFSDYAMKYDHKCLGDGLHWSTIPKL